MGLWSGPRLAAPCLLPGAASRQWPSAPATLARPAAASGWPGGGVPSLPLLSRDSSTFSPWPRWTGA
eukprot:7582726-Alexandrium_andersonii.AAC.1